jgi:hypothetical protein
MGSIAWSERSTDRTLPLRLSLATASIAAGLIHATFAPHHLEESTILGAGFVATAIFQIAWSAPASVRLDARTLDVGVAVNGAVVAAWIASRTVGLPFGPHAWVAEPVGAVDATATVLELLIVIGATIVRVSEPDESSERASHPRREEKRLAHR